MFFRRKGKIRKEEDEKLISLIEELKDQLYHQREIVNKSVDPSPSVIYELDLTEVKYLFFLREARVRQTSMNGKD
jgi:hypothetical protein